MIDPVNKEEKIIINNKKELEEYYLKHREDIWIGFNNRGYDQWILKGILCDFNPYEISKHIIQYKKHGYMFSDALNKIQVINYDVGDKFRGLKTLEGFMGNDIRETEVPFNLDRKLTPEELAQTVKYCRHDVQQTIEVFLQKKNEFDAQLSLIKTFKLPLKYIGKTQAQLAAVILGATSNEYIYIDEWDISVPDTLKLDKYKFVADWFLDKSNHDIKSKLNCEIADLKHVIGWGGIHGAKSKYQYTCKDDELLIMADVDQLYPSMMVKYKLLSRSVSNYKKFEFILFESLRLKKEKKKKEREPYKRICNITYGAEGDKFNAMYDPRNRNLVCVFGQLFLVDLIEKIEHICEVIQLGKIG